MENITRELTLAMDGLIASHIGPVREIVAGNTKSIEAILSHLEKLNGRLGKVETKVAEMDANGSRALHSAMELANERNATLHAVIENSLSEHSIHCPVVDDVAALKQFVVSSNTAAQTSAKWWKVVQPILFGFLGTGSLLLLYFMLLHGPEVAKILAR